MCQVMIYTLEKCPAVNKPDKVLADYRGRNTGYEKQKQKIVIADINYEPAIVLNMYMFALHKFL